jgi:hypothetical protein
MNETISHGAESNGHAAHRINPTNTQAGELAALRKEVRSLRRLADGPAVALEWATALQKIHGLMSPATTLVHEVPKSGPRPQADGEADPDATVCEALARLLCTDLEKQILHTIGSGCLSGAELGKTLGMLEDSPKPGKKQASGALRRNLARMREAKLIVQSGGYRLSPDLIEIMPFLTKVWGTPASPDWEEPARCHTNPRPEKAEQPLREAKLSDLEERARNGQPLFTPNDRTD